MGVTHVQFNKVTSANSCILYSRGPRTSCSSPTTAGTSGSSSPAPPGTALTLSNSKCSVNVGEPSVTASGADLILNPPVTFTSSYDGSKSIYVYAASARGNAQRMKGHDGSAAEKVEYPFFPEEKGYGDYPPLDVRRILTSLNVADGKRSHLGDAASGFPAL